VTDDNPLVCAIVVGQNDRVWLPACLTTLCASDYSRLEVIYVDNASTDESVDCVKSLAPAIQIVRNSSNLGFAVANNQALTICLNRAVPYAFLVNPDTRTPTGLVSGLVKFMERHQEYGIVGPIQLDYGADSLGQFNAWSRKVLSNGDRHLFYAWDSNRPSLAEPPACPNAGEHSHVANYAYVEGAALFARTSTLRHIGIFDPVYHSYYEEVDLCRRCRKGGHGVGVLLDLHIEHKRGGGTVGNRVHKRAYYYTRNKYYYLFTDPEYLVRDALSLGIRWFARDVMNSIYHQGKLPCTIMQLLQIMCWLGVKVGRIARQRSRLVHMSIED